jgi:hypothetical protein
MLGPHSSPPSADEDRAADAVENFYLSYPDPESRFVVATDLAFCDHKEDALRLMKSAIDGKYCAYVGLQKDPTLASLRGTPKFDQSVDQSLSTNCASTSGRFLAPQLHRSGVGFGSLSHLPVSALDILKTEFQPQSDPNGRPLKFINPQGPGWPSLVSNVF